MPARVRDSRGGRRIALKGAVRGVARRRRVPPAKIAASTVVVRFTIERDGRVRDAEALIAAGTDLEVAACAKRVVSQWVFAKRAKDATVVERTYRFGGSTTR